MLAHARGFHNNKALTDRFRNAKKADLEIGGEYRNRTGLHGFAIRCITYLPTRLVTRHLRMTSDKVKRLS